MTDGTTDANGTARRRAPDGELASYEQYPFTDACRTGSAERVGMWGHPDQEEGPLAFTGKREPQWQEI